MKFFFFIILPISIFYCLIEYHLRKIPNNFSYKNNWVTENSSHVKILTFGSSHGYYGINPSYFTETAFNCAYVSQSLKYDLFIINKFIPKCDSLKCIILPISYLSLFVSMEGSAESWRIKNYSIYYGCDYHKYEPKYNLAFYDDNLSRIKYRLINYYKNKKTEIDCSNLGFGSEYVLNKRWNDWENTGRTDAIRQTAKYNLLEEYNNNLKYLNEIITKCAQKNITLILTTTPTWHTYYDNLNKDQLTLAINTCKNLKSKNKNVLYFNFLKDERFNSNDFFDGDHLDTLGAMKFTRILNDSLISHGILNVKL